MTSSRTSHQTTTSMITDKITNTLSTKVAPALLGLTILVAAGLFSGGCNSQRPLHVVERDARYAASKGDYEKAKADWSEFLTRKPDAVEKRLELAKAYNALGDHTMAVEQLTVAGDVDPMNDIYLDAQADSLFRKNERDALTVLLTRATTERGRASDYLRLAKYTQLLGNPDEAQQALLTAAKIDGGRTVGPQLALADFYQTRGDTAKSVQRLRMAYFLEPENKTITQRIRAAGEIPGPSFALWPTERPATAK